MNHSIRQASSLFIFILTIFGSVANAENSLRKTIDGFFETEGRFESKEKPVHTLTSPTDLVLFDEQYCQFDMDTRQLNCPVEGTLPAGTQVVKSGGFRKFVKYNGPFAARGEISSIFVADQIAYVSKTGELKTGFIMRE